MREQKCSRMSGLCESLLIAGMEYRYVIKHRGPMDSPIGERIRIGMKAHRGNFRTRKAGGKERVRGFKVENSRRLVRAGPQYVFERCVERNRIICAEKLNATAPERIRISRYQLPMVLFAAEAKDSHAGIMS